MTVSESIARGDLRCVVTHQKLRLTSEQSLVSEDGKTHYPVIHGVPHILRDQASTAAYLAVNPAMEAEYAHAKKTGTTSILRRVAMQVKGLLAHDFRTPASRAAFAQLMQSADATKTFLSIGGGPVVVHPHLTNLNIGPFANVAIVADAHALPYADATVDGIYCEAVLEHLSDPAKAVAEMFRVLKPGALVFAATPFLQAFHGYPNHFQNYTLFGHERLFTSHGFTRIDSGCCVGPVNALLTLNARAIGLYIPGIVGKLLKGAFQLLTLWMRPLDRLLAKSPNSHMLASTTYVLMKK